MSCVESATPSSLTAGSRDLWTWVGQVLLFTILYFIAGRLGLTFTYKDTATLVIWPPMGLSLAALIIFGRHLWPGILIGSLLVNLALPVAWTAQLGIAIGSTLEALVGVTLLTRVADFRPTLERTRDGVAFLLIGVLGCTTISATIGTASTILSGDTDVARLGPVWLIWWLGDVGSALVLTPVLLMLVYGTPSWRSLARRLETWLVLAILLTLSLFAFFGTDLGLLSFATAVTPFAVLVWAGTRLGPRGATMASFLIVSIAMIATGIGSGPYVTGTATEAMFLLWPYSIFSGMMAFILAAVVEQRNLADRKYRTEETERLRAEKQKLLLLERERFTREIHDGLGGQLVSVLAMVERGQAAPSEVAEGLRRAIDDIQIVIDSLDPKTTDLLASLGKLRARLEPLLQRNGIALAWSVDEKLARTTFTPEVVLHLLRIIQESVTNTLRHANANDVEMEITLADDEPRHIHLWICDNGRGLPTSPATGGRGFGNMTKRAEELGAEIRIEDTGSGTLIDLVLPL